MSSVLFRSLRYKLGLIMNELEDLESRKQCMVEQPVQGEFDEEAYALLCDQITSKESELNSLCVDIHEICD